MEGQAKDPIIFVDLAGFESAKGKENVKESQFINRSLFELNQVLLSISQKCIPNFNANPLTLFLKPFLNSNSQTLMLYHVSKNSIKVGFEYIKDVVSKQKDVKRKQSNHKPNPQYSKIPRRALLRN